NESPEWVGAYKRRISYAELLKKWTNKVCPHTSLVGCAKNGCIGLPKELYAGRMHWEEKPALQPNTSVPSYVEATSSSLEKHPQTLHQRRTGRGLELTVENLSKEIRRKEVRSDDDEILTREDVLLDEVTSSTKTLTVKDHVSPSHSIASILDSPPPPYASLLIVCDKTTKS
ncbi:hypothetical protein SK128_006402, partial [Halocaridina rubra]